MIMADLSQSCITAIIDLEIAQSFCLRRRGFDETMDFTMNSGRRSFQIRFSYVTLQFSTLPSTSVKRLTFPRREIH
jgi:hypothetical protein